MRYFDESEREEKLRIKLMSLAITGLVGALIGGTMRTMYASLTGDTQLEFSTEDSSLDDLMDLIQRKMSANSYYSQTVTDDSTRQDVFLEKIVPFINRYYPYLGDEEIATLLYFIDYQFPTYDFADHVYGDILDEAWDVFLEKVNSRESSGYGLRQSMFYVSENTVSDSYNECHRGASRELFTLLEVVGYDNLMSVIFESDNQKIVDVICQETSIDQEHAFRLLQLFDMYYEYDIRAVEGAEMRSDLLDEMKSILSLMIKSKCESNSEFNSSLIASILKNSYLKEDPLTFEINRFYDDSTFLFEMELENYGKTKVQLPLYYLNAHMDISTLIDSAACYIIRTEYKHDNYSWDTINLLSYIVGWDHIDYMSSANEKKKVYYRDLEKYFSSEEEFNRFLVALDGDNEVAIRKYFSIWKPKMMDGPITFRKLLEYNSLRETIISRCEVEYSDYSELALVTEKSSDLGEMFEINDYYFYPTEYDYMADFDEVMDYFHAQNSTYTELISKDSYYIRDWMLRGDRSIDIDNTFVLSQPLSAQEKDLGNGHMIRYYVKPKEFASVSGEFVYAFTNVLNQRTEIPISGISTVLENEETGEMEEVIIVSLDEEMPYGEAYYKADYCELYPKEYQNYISYY